MSKSSNRAVKVDPTIIYSEIDHLVQQEHIRAERLAAKLRELGIDPETLS